jgi:HK97 family phage portal protein
MPFLEQLTKLQAPIPPSGTTVDDLPRGAAYSSYYPAWETQTPQYITPNPYQVTQASWRTNEFVYSIIQARAEAISEAPLRFFDDTGETPEEMEDSPMREFLDEMNQFLPEPAFWGVSEISRCLGGFAAWEVETNNLGQPLKLWFMRPDWCSFIRAQQKPLAYIRYQPYGLPFVDIPIERVLFMFSPTENFDPLFPFIKFLSPAMLALRQINVDTGMTNFLDGFIKRGARFGGMISVAQTLAEDTAKRLRQSWEEQHGGTENWSRPLIMGQGAKYEPMQMNFDDMAFPQLDARAETRICNAFRIDPIVANARAGLDVSSYNNKSQATKDWYNGWAMPTWKMYASQFGQQMLPRWGYDSRKYYAEFHTEDIYALVDDKYKARQFWLGAFTARAITKNELREQINLDPVDGGDEFEKPAAPVLPFAGANKPEPPAQQQEPTPPTEAETEAKNNEARKFREFAKRRMKEKKSALIGSYEFKFHTLDEQAILLAEFGVMAEADPLVQLAEAINNAYNNQGVENA